MLNQIPKEQKPNNLFILACYKNFMPNNVKYFIRDAQIEDLNGAMIKETKME